MTHPYFKELKEYTLDEILRKTGKKDRDKKRIEALLENQRYITTKKDPNTGIKKYSFEYVGVVILNDFVFRLFPKYINEDTPDFEKVIDNKFRKILRVIRKALKKNIPQLNYGTFEESEYNFLQSAVSLLDDYHLYGLYSNDIEYIEENGDGDVSWDETIVHVTPVIVKNFHIYDPLLTWDIANDDANLIREIHSIILSDCSEKLKKYDLLEILSISPVYLTNKKLGELGEPEYIIEILRKELANQYVTQKQTIIKMLINYIDNEYSKKPTGRGLKGIFTRSYYGVNLFWPVWEDICKTVLKGSIQRKIDTLPLSDEYKASEEYKYFKTKNESLADIIEKPVWIKETTDKEGKNINKIFKSKTYKPDAVCVYQHNKDLPSNDMNSFTFAILDAKYYIFDIQDIDDKTIGIEGTYPGIEDITKQFMYQQAYNSFIKKNGYGKICNAFLCPTDKQTHKACRIEFDLIQSMRQNSKLEDIQVIKVNADDIYDCYLSPSKGGFDLCAFL